MVDRRNGSMSRSEDKHEARAKFIAPLSFLGLLCGTVFFTISLTPSLLPRPFALQGVISGLSFAFGYGLGTACLALWHYLQLPVPSRRKTRLGGYLMSAICLSMLVASLWYAAYWQNSIRGLMGVEETAGIQPILILPVAALVFFILLLAARLFHSLSIVLSARLDRHVPPRISRFLAVVLSVLLFWTVIDGLLIGFLLRTADQSFQQLDALIYDDLPRPRLAEQTGSDESLINWVDLGRQGRNFVSSGPTGEELSAFFGYPVPTPIRVYVGLNSAERAEQRARLALEELIRAGGFERSFLLLVTPTGSGWVDPGGQDSIEYLQRGDIATVAAQYSYLSSPLVLLTQASYGAEMSRALFREIYGYWRSLPADARPRLYLSGLSLGAHESDLSFDFFDIIDDPFQGILWTGPPFVHHTWQSVTAQRNPDSPSWLPTFRNGSVVRFMNQQKKLAENNGEWGQFRILFLQYASDPITFFSPHYAWHAPEWLNDPRGHDVSPDLRWFPVVTMLQLAVDMVVGTEPQGFGHEYAPGDYLEAWLELTEPKGWSEPELARLRSLFNDSGP